MDYTPPPPIERLIISIDEASYDEARGIASIQIEQAFATSKIIRAYGGDEITLIYKNSKSELGNCPAMRVNIQDIKRDIIFSENSVILKISGITKDMASNIKQALCFTIDAGTVKIVSSINYDPHSPSGLKDLTSTLNE